MFHVVQGLGNVLLVAIVMVAAFVCYCIFGNRNVEKNEAEQALAEAEYLEQMKAEAKAAALNAAQVAQAAAQPQAFANEAIGLEVPSEDGLSEDGLSTLAAEHRPTVTTFYPDGNVVESNVIDDLITKHDKADDLAVFELEDDVDTNAEDAAFAERMSSFEGQAASSEQTIQPALRTNDTEAATPGGRVMTEAELVAAAERHLHAEAAENAVIETETEVGAATQSLLGQTTNLQEAFEKMQANLYADLGAAMFAETEIEDKEKLAAMAREALAAERSDGSPASADSSESTMVMPKADFLRMAAEAAEPLKDAVGAAGTTAAAVGVGAGTAAGLAGAAEAAGSGAAQAAAPVAGMAAAGVAGAVGMAESGGNAAAVSNILLPEKPLAFGYKMAWVAIPGVTPKDVISAFRIKDITPANWTQGLTVSYDDNKSLFVSPNLNGWVLVIGRALWSKVDLNLAVENNFWLKSIGSRFPELYYFSTMRTLENHCWLRMKDGTIERAYGVSGELGEVMWNYGQPTLEEIALLPDFNQPGTTVFPTEKDVLTMAAAWSINTAFADGTYRPDIGFVGTI